MTAGNLSDLQPSSPLLESSHPEPRTSLLAYLVPGLFIALVSLVVFTLTRFGAFNGEDFTLMSQLTARHSLGDNIGYFSRDWGLDGRYYAPLTRLFFLVEYQLFQTRAANWHLVSALLHTGCAVLVWLLAWLFTRRRAVALCAGLFFALQPVHVAVVAQPASQAELLAAFFSLLAACAYVHARQLEHGSLRALPEKVGSAPLPANPALFYWLSVGAYGLALGCKQEALALPLALLGYDFVTRGLDQVLHHQNENEDEAGPVPGRARQSLWRGYLPFLVLLGLYLLLNNLVLGGLNAYLPGPNQRSDIGEFLRGNLRLLSEPFSLDGTDGLILLAALGAFLALTGVQEWEAWQLNNPGAGAARPTAPSPSRPVEDDEMDNPTALSDNLPGAVVQSGEPARPPLPLAPDGATATTPADYRAEPVNIISPATPVEPVATTSTPVEPVARPVYLTLRAAGYSLLWAAAFLLPFVLLVAGPRTLYLPSAGFAIFMAAALAPFGLFNVHKASSRVRARTLFGAGELSFWLRVAAVVAVIAIYFAASVNRIDEWNKASKPVAELISNLLGLL